eukprot:219667-Rhodomonas_salina.2
MAMCRHVFPPWIWKFLGTKSRGYSSITLFSYQIALFSIQKFQHLRSASGRPGSIASNKNMPHDATSHSTCRYQNVNVTPVPTNVGHIVMFLASASDVSERISGPSNNL